MSKGFWDKNRKDGYNINFNGRKYKKCTPTDIDWAFEIKNKFLIFAEVKRSEKQGGLPTGQKILAENMVKYIPKETIPVFFLHVVGDVDDEGVLNIEEGKVVSCYSNINKKWENRDIVFKDVIDKIIEKYADKKTNNDNNTNNNFF